MRMSFTGRTALVTGASAGIGREIARQLAPEVGTLILVARRLDRLEELADELDRARRELRIVVKPVDLLDREATATALDDLERAGESVDVLVNNAGFGDYGLFLARDFDKIERMLSLNIVSASYLLHRLVPAMVERRFGAVLNVGSTAGVFPAPGMAAYAASKAYLNHLNESLRGELAGTGVWMTALCPGPVATEFQEVAGTGTRPPVPEPFHVDAERCAREALAGLRRGHARVVPGRLMHAAVLSFEALPKAAARPVLGRMGKRLRGDAE